MHTEAGSFHNHSEQKERPSETQKFRETINHLIEKTKKLSPDEGHELESEFATKFGSVEHIPVHAEVVQEIARLMARYVPNFEIKFEGTVYPKKVN